MMEKLKFKVFLDDALYL